MMRCPTCGGATLTLETRQRMTGVYRRRTCAQRGVRLARIVAESEAMGRQLPDAYRVHIT